MKAIFIDSGPFVAVINPGDQYQDQARQGWLQLAELNAPLFSSEHVLDEVATAICRTQTPRNAATWVNQQLENGVIRWLSCGADDWRTATRWLSQYSDQKINFTDALSFTLMRKLKVTEAFTFDRHFSLAGFHHWTAES